jgi:hypothetical protein
MMSSDRTAKYEYLKISTETSIRDLRAVEMFCFIISATKLNSHNSGKDDDGDND